MPARDLAEVARFARAVALHYARRTD